MVQNASSWLIQLGYFGQSTNELNSLTYKLYHIKHTFDQLFVFVIIPSAQPSLGGITRLKMGCSFMFFMDVALVSMETLAKKVNPFYGDGLQLTCFRPRNTIFTLEVTSVSHFPVSSPTLACQNNIESWSRD